MFLEKIQSPQDVKKLDRPQLEVLCSEIRSVLISTVSKTGGHLASNLGVVELTVALHKVFDSPTDQIVWDVGHQCYTHKLLTGRRDRFDTLRQLGGLSGFPKQKECVHDAFVAGHSGNSISAASGILAAKEALGEDGHAIAVIGDGSFTNGEVFEGLNNAGRSGQKIIVILNDNEMSISRNVGALAKYLAKMRSTPSYFAAKDATEEVLRHIPVLGKPLYRLLSSSKDVVKQALYHSNFFEEFGYTYLGPVDGHDLESLCDVLTRAKELNEPVFVHVETKKGRGYPPAEKNPSRFHGVSRFDVTTGKPLKPAVRDYSAVFGEALTALAREDKRICAVTAAMQQGTGLTPFYKAFRGTGRFFDVGIAESHAVTFCAGMASKGMIPVFAVYSTFLQRAVDQVIHDCAIEPKHVILALDRAGIVGDDGETHQGLFDVPLLSPVPGITIYSPCTFRQLERCLETAVHGREGVVALRYPKGPEPVLAPEYTADTDNYFHLERGSGTLIITYGRLWAEACRAEELLREQGTAVDLLQLVRILPLEEAVINICMGFRRVLFYEECIRQGSVGQQLGTLLLEQGYTGRYELHAINNTFVPQGSIPQALHNLKLDSAAIVERVLGEEPRE